MIEYYEQLTQEEQQALTETIQLLYRQTYILERKFDKRTSRFKPGQEFRVCDRHLEFIREYFKISGIQVLENSQLGVIYLQGESLLGDKLPKLATLYLLILKVIYDEKMSAASTSVQIYTTLSDIHERLGSLRILKNRPAVTEIKRALSLLKKYQMIEPVDTMEEIDGDSRMIIYPCVQLVLLGEDIRALLLTFTQGEDEDDEPEL